MAVVSVEPSRQNAPVLTVATFNACYSGFLEANTSITTIIGITGANTTTPVTASVQLFVENILVAPAFRTEIDCPETSAFSSATSMACLGE
jgi:hypothetical protein